MLVRNRTLDPKIIKEIEFLNEKYFPFDDPVPFLEGLTLYPVNIRNYNEFLACSSCCTLNKNEDMEGITMTNLGYLISKMEDVEAGRVWSMQLSRLIELVFKIQNGVRCEDCSEVVSFEEFAQTLDRDKEKTICKKCGGTNFCEAIKYSVNPKTSRKELIVNGININSNNFDRFRQIVMYQNLPDFKDDSWVEAEVREDQRAKQEILARQGGNVTATLEKKMVCVSAKTAYKMEDIYKLSIRKFLMILTAVDEALTYESDRIGLMTGMVSSKKPLEHWIYKKEGSIYGEAVSADSYYGEINSAQ